VGVFICVRCVCIFVSREMGEKEGNKEIKYVMWREREMGYCV